MSEENSKKEEASPVVGPMFKPAVDDPVVPSIFVNNTNVGFTNKDITVLLIQDIPSHAASVSKPLVRASFTHAGFVETVRFLQRYADFLESVYGSPLPSLASFDNEIVVQRMKEFGIRISSGPDTGE